MKILLSSIGSRGDVQPIVALGVELMARGHQSRLCAAPDFGEWIESYGLEFVPIGPDLRKMTGGTGPVGVMQQWTKEQLQQLADDSVRDPFRLPGERVVYYSNIECRMAGGSTTLADLSVRRGRGMVRMRGRSRVPRWSGG